MQNTVFFATMHLLTIVMNSTHYDTILFVGRPGSGKGTQAEQLAAKLGWKILSSGAQFRELRNGTGALSERARAVYDQGQLFPNWFADYLFEKGVVETPLSEGLILEGFGRSAPQAALMLDVLTWLGRRFVVVNLDVSEEETIARQMKRNETDKRPDSDSEEKLKARLAEYRANTEPALAYFREKGVCIDVDGMPAIEAIHADILTKLNIQ